ncbi:TlpA family protein disulfide reductase [Sphingobacterium cellulitidis]|uniref:TlpA family protein disulfide reductase n=1 Tax=Sphingobacterium cellulitidis TaxID=1768011 RepID=UPI000B93FF91|nr:hypothetical protein CHT99_04115 [Sphingobacterium cellulitidis]
MKRILTTIFLIFLSLSSWAQVSNISGTIEPGKFKKMFLYKVINGRMLEVASSVPDAQGRFAFRFTPEYEGFYCFGYGSSIMTQGINKLYFRGNEDLEVRADADGYKLIKSNSKENDALYQWETAVKNIQTKALTLGNSTYVDFFPELEEIASNIKDLSKDPKTGNKEFDKQFEQIVKTDLAFYAINFLYIPHSAHPSKEEYSDYYMDFKADEYMTDWLLKYPFGDRFLNSLVMFKNQGLKEYNLENLLSSIPNQVLKGQYFLNYAERLNSMEDYLKLLDKNKQNLVLEEQKARTQAIEMRLAETKEGVPGFNFSFKDLNDKVVSLKDLKGKVVLLDLWATWCGPCRAEEPHWEKLNEDYKDKTVAFLGISTDQDKAKWLEYMQEKKPKGIQLHAGPNNPLSTAYKVNAIPRYILMDKNGNLISADSPRPSDPKLRMLLDTWIKK